MIANRCYTCFVVQGDFNPDVLTDRLGLKPDRTVKTGERLLNGGISKLATWEFGCCGDYHTATDNQMQETIAPLLEKIPLLQEIRETWDVTFTLKIIPFLYTRNIVPRLAPSLRVMDFCHETRTQIDIDLYVLEQTP